MREVVKDGDFWHKRLGGNSCGGAISSRYIDRVCDQPRGEHTNFLDQNGPKDAQVHFSRLKLVVDAIVTVIMTRTATFVVAQPTLGGSDYRPSQVTLLIMTEEI